jgi:hypothetical protein
MLLPCSPSCLRHLCRAVIPAGYYLKAPGQVCSLFCWSVMPHCIIQSHQFFPGSSCTMVQLQVTAGAYLPLACLSVSSTPPHNHLVHGTDSLTAAGCAVTCWSQVAPCPRGEWKAGEGPSGNCTKCAFGVTTKLEGSTLEQNCTDVVPGRYASAISGVIVQSTQICPQKYYW